MIFAHNVTDARRAGGARSANDAYVLTDQAVSRIRNAAREAEFVIVSASNGLDMTEGLNIFQPDAHFYENYGDFAQKYGVNSVLQGLFAQWTTEEAHWAFIARFAQREWLDYQPSDAMRRALALASGNTELPADASAEAMPSNARPHFVVTCNMDGRFVRAGVDPSRVLETEGSIRYLRCSRGCHDELYPAEQTYRKLAAAATVDCSVPTYLIPHCPHCGAPLVPAIDEARAYRPDAAYRTTKQALDEFLTQAHSHKLLVLELGIGARNQAIKRPLMELVAREPRATYVTFNYREVSIPRQIAAKSVGVSGDMGSALARIVPDA